MEKNFIVSVLEVFVLIQSMIISVLLYRTTKKMNSLQKNEIKKKETTLHVEDIISLKKTDNFPSDLLYHRYISKGTDMIKKHISEEETGVDIDKIDANKMIGNLNLSSLIKELIERRGTAYFSYFKKKPILFLNLIEKNAKINGKIIDDNIDDDHIKELIDNPEFKLIIDHNNVIIKLNYEGDKPLEMHLINATIHYTGGSVKTLQGYKDNFINIINEIKDSYFYVSFDEITLDYNNTVCKFKDGIQKALDDEWYLLRTPIDTKYILYDKLIFNLRVRNIYGKDFYHRIVIEKMDNVMRARSEKYEPVNNYLDFYESIE